MPETPKPTNLEALEQFKKEFNLDPLNNEAIVNCLFTLNEELRTHRAESVNGFFDHDERIFALEDNQK